VPYDYDIVTQAVAVSNSRMAVDICDLCDSIPFEQYHRKRILVIRTNQASPPYKALLKNAGCAR
jgi:hypothetical protein